jgi:CRP-like cAMP-binding protein
VKGCAWPRSIHDQRAALATTMPGPGDVLRGPRDAQVEQYRSQPVKQRLAATLLLLGEKLGAEHDGLLLIQMLLSRQDLAEMAGPTIETASHVPCHEPVLEGGPYRQRLPLGGAR